MSAIDLAMRRGPICVWAFIARLSDATTITVAQCAEDPETAGPEALARIHRAVRACIDPMPLIVHDRLLRARYAEAVSHALGGSDAPIPHPEWSGTIDLIRQTRGVLILEEGAGDDPMTVDRLIAAMDAAVATKGPWEKVTTKGSTWGELQRPA